MKRSVKPELGVLNPGPLARALLGEIDEIVLFKVPLNTRFRGVDHREGLLLRGTEGWGECAPFWDYGPQESATWLASALSVASSPFPQARRTLVPLNLTVPVTPASTVEARIDSQPGCATAKVKVADRGELTHEDLERVRFAAGILADRYGALARVRVDANAVWSVEQAARALQQLDAAAALAGGLEYAEQPCKSTEELAELRTLTDVPIAADESIWRAANPLAVSAMKAADVAVLKVAPLGGIRAGETLSRKLGLSPVVSSALDTSIGIAAGVGLAAALPELPYACGLNTGSLLAADVVDQPLVSGADSENPGFLSAAAAAQAHRGELSSSSLPPSGDLLDVWRSRLEKMAAVLLAEETRNRND